MKACSVLAAGDSCLVRTQIFARCEEQDVAWRLKSSWSVDKKLASEMLLRPFLLVLLLTSATLGRAFSPGELIPTQHRTQHRGKRTAWADAPSRCRPTFGAAATTAEYAVRFGDEELHTDWPLQVEFSFGEGHAKLDDPEAHRVWHGSAASRKGATGTSKDDDQREGPVGGGWRKERESGRGAIAAAGAAAIASSSSTSSTPSNVGHHTGGARQHSTGWITAWDGSGRYLTRVEITMWTHVNRIEKVTYKATYTGAGGKAASDRPQQITLAYSSVALREADPGRAAAVASWVVSIAVIAAVFAILREECASSMVSSRRGGKGKNRRKGKEPRPRFDLDLYRAFGGRE